MKDYSAETIAALESGEAIVSGALAIYCDDPAFVWGGPWPIELDGDVYTPLDDNALGSMIGGQIGGTEQKTTLKLSGVDADALALLDAGGLSQAPAKLYRLVFAGDGRTLLDARVVKRGKIDDVVVEDIQGGKATVQISLESAARGLGRSGKRMRSDADQRLIDPMDGFFKHVAYASTKTIYFGGQPSSAGRSVGGSAGGGGGIPHWKRPGANL